MIHHTLLLSKDKSRTRFALLDKKKQPLEFGIDYPTQRNAIYTSHVLDIQAAFGMVFFDLSPHFKQPGLFSTNSMLAKKFLKNQSYMVQIRFAPLSNTTFSGLRTKGPKVTPELRLSCPYFIYLPQTAGIFFSKRLEKRKIEPLLPYLRSLLTPHEGLILRPLCEQASLTSFQNHLNDLKEKSQIILNKKNSTLPETCIYKAPSFLFQKLEDVAYSLSTILVDERNLFNEISDFLKKYDLSCSVEFKPRNPLQESLFESFALEERWEEALSPFVPLPSGGNLIIEKTEGFWAVDINSQGRENISRSSSPKTLNEEAAKSLFHAIRLRNLAGKIIVDFLPFPQKKDLDNFYLFLKQESLSDPIPLKISLLNPTGLCEIIREKIEPSLFESIQLL